MNKIIKEIKNTRRKVLFGLTLVSALTLNAKNTKESFQLPQGGKEKAEAAGYLQTIVDTVTARNDSYISDIMSGTEPDSTFFDPTYNLNDKEKEAYSALFDFYSSIDERVASDYARVTLDWYKQLDPKQADSIMSILYNSLEDQRIAMAREQAYKIGKGDSDKLRTLKRSAGGSYKEWLVYINKYYTYSEQLAIMQAERDTLLSQGVNLDSLDEANPAQVKARVELSVKDANTRRDLVVSQEQLVKLDKPLRLQQLNEDIKNLQEELKRIEANIEKWDDAQKIIDQLDVALSKLKLSNYNPDEMQGLHAHDNPVAKSSQKIAQENAEKFGKAEQIKLQKKNKQKEQLQIAPSREYLDSLQSLTEQYLKDAKVERKEVKRTKGDIVNPFKKVNYEDSKICEAFKAMIVPAENTNARTPVFTIKAQTKDETANVTNKSNPVVTNEVKAPEILLDSTSMDSINVQIQHKTEEWKNYLASQAGVQIDTSLISPQNISQTIYTFDDGHKAVLYEYPNGKMSLSPKSGEYIIYNIDGKVSEFNIVGKQCSYKENGTVKSSDLGQNAAAQIWKEFNIPGGGR